LTDCVTRTHIKRITGGTFRRQRQVQLESRPCDQNNVHLDDAVAGEGEGDVYSSEHACASHVKKVKVIGRLN
jgi:hypothetical protein